MDHKIIVPEILGLILKSRWYNNTLRASTAGSVRQNLTFDLLQKLEVPLPSIITQQAILAEWRKAQVEIAAVEQRIELQAKKARSNFLAALGIEVETLSKKLKCFTVQWSELERWSVEYMMRKFLCLGKSSTGKYSTRLLSELCDGLSGSTPNTKDPRFWNGDIPWISPKDMKASYIHDAEDHITQMAVDEAGSPLVSEGSVLIVMRSGILQRMVPVALLKRTASINQDLRAFLVKNESVLLPDFLAVYLDNRQEELLRLVKWSTTVQSLNKAELDTFPIPLPPLDVQLRLVHQNDSLREQRARERESVREIARRIEADLESWLLGEKKVKP